MASMRISSVIAVATQASAELMACADMNSPSMCTGEDDAKGYHSCAWLSLEGRCDNHDSAMTKNTTADCCVSMAPGTHCKYSHSKSVPDGACSAQVDSVGASAVSFDLSHAKRMLHFAGAAYCSASQIQSWSCGEHCDSVSGLSMITYINHAKQELAGFVAYDSTEDAIIVSFRGTVSSSIMDWINNLDFKKTNPWSQYPDAGVHRGFNGAWNDLKSDVLSAIDNIRGTHSTKLVQVTGHSLGAAMAINAALDLKLNHDLKPSVVDFGRPRAGDDAFSQAVSSEGISVFRVTHHHDIVPHAPPKIMGFYHTSHEVYYEGSGASEYKLCNGSGEDASCSNSCSPLSCTSVADHLLYMGYTVGSGGCASSDEFVSV